MAYEACIICGIKKGFHIYKTCKQDAKLWGIELVDIPEIRKSEHYWTWHPERTVPMNYGKEIDKDGM